MPYKNILGSWENLALKLMKDKDFGADFTSADKPWLNEINQGLTLNGKSEIDKARLVYFRTNYYPSKQCQRIQVGIVRP